MSSGEQHLSRDQIDSLIETQPGGEGLSARPELSDEARRHLDACEECQRLVRMQEEIDRRLGGLKDEAEAAPTKDCPSLKAWCELISGILPEGRAEKLLEHATSCGHCGPLLRQAIEDLSGGPTPEEELALTGLGSANPNWQTDLASTIAAQQIQDKAKRAELAPNTLMTARQKATVPRWIYAAAAMFVVVVGGTWFFLAFHKPSVDQLLAQAYAEQRTMEMRIKGAPYSPLRVERGLTGSMPAELHEAMAMILHGLSSNPQDPKLLDEKGRSQLVQGDYNGAISSLEHARRIEPKSSVILTDLASAYFQTAERGGPAANYGKTIELLGEALAINPDDPVALFNRALANDKIPGNEQQAMADYEHYLRIDPNSDWTPEVRRRQEELRRRVAERKKSTSYLDPQTFPRSIQKDQDGVARSSGSLTSSLDEQALNLAITEWLPAIYAGSGGTASLVNFERERARLISFAHSLAERHGDLWLLDILASRPSPSFVRGITALGRALLANNTGDPVAAELESQVAEKSFRAAASSAGLLRAHLENVYALQRELRVADCLSATKELKNQILGSRYVWIQIQLLLEESACKNMVGDMGGEEFSMAHALEMSQSHAYGTLYLRALGFSAGIERAKGNWNKSWALDLEGLRLYTAGDFPPLRAYQFISDLALSAETAEQWYLATVLWQEATSVLAEAGNRALEAQAHYELGSARSMVGESTEAAKEFEISNELYALLPATSATRAYKMNGEISLAALEVNRGNYDSALARIGRVRPDLPLVSDYEIPMHFYSTLGELQLHRGHVQDADRTFRSAIAIAEWGLGSLRSDSDKLAWERQTGHAYRTLVEIKLRDQNDSTGALELWEWFRGSAQRSQKRGIVPRIDDAKLEAGPSLPNLSKIAEFLPHLTDTTVVVYASLTNGYAAWSFDNRGVEAKWLPLDRRKVEDLARTFADECADPSSSESTLKIHGSQLYQWLIAPLASHFEPGRTLALEADGILGRVPLQALVDDSGKYLGSAYAIVSFPGVLFARELRTGTRFDGRETALIVGAPALSGDLATTFPPLPDAEGEATKVAGCFKKNILLIGEQANLRRVLKELPRAQVFHFAGHSFSGPDRGGLLLAQSGEQTEENTEGAVLNAGNLGRNALQRCELAVLSSCPTGNGEINDVVNPESLVRAFFRAGVPCVIASRWNVDSRSTANFMNTFYTELLSGVSVANAVQSAAAELRNHPETSHPYFWSAFTAYGAS